MKKYSVRNNTLTYHDDVETIGWIDTPGDIDKIKRIVIPSSVKEIKKEVFKGSEALEEVVLSEGLESIGESAFAACPRLREVIFPQGLEDIGENAFSECSSLERIVIHPGTQEINIWDEAFANCTNLREVELDDTLDYTSFRLNVFKNTAFLTELRKKDPLVIINDEIIDGKECQGDLVIPDYVKGVNCGAFADNTKLTSVVCPDTVEFVSYSAFEGCTSLRKVVLPANMENLSEAIFRDCTSLEEVVLPKNENLHIYGYAFRNTPYQKARQKEDGSFILNGWLVDGSSCKGEVHLSGIKGISAYAFRLNHEITKVVVDEGC
ncbi:MAG: leucine-rich repeat domain-containing protein [Paludibacteraceae bacterium]|nr:leucine-rich repeat domain-containing protein [Paludibacteraceae bacterium]